MTLTMRYAARSDRGLIRSGNQDSVYAGPRLLAVADGMGGMAAGDIASNIVIATLARLDEDVPGNAPLDELRQAVDAANQQIRAAVEENPAMEGMGTTLTGLLFSGNKFGLVHIGDSRAYLLRSGELTQITRDDTYVQLLVDEGQITAEEANTHPQKSLLMRALDGRDTDPEYSVREAVAGDRYLICSDGLSGVVSDDTIAATMREHADLNQCAERLVSLALRGGGPDNITVIVADVTDGGIVEESPIVGGAAATDGALSTTVDISTPAARASALAQPAAAPRVVGRSSVRGAEHRRHPIRAAVIILVVAALLAGGVWFGWRYTQSQYYVGVTEDGTVAIFKGIPGQIAGFGLSTVDYVSDTRLDELTPVAQQKVREGIQAPSKADAQIQLDALLNPESKNLLPYCPQPSPSSIPPSLATPTPTAAPGSASPGASATATPPPSGSPAAATTTAATLTLEPLPTGPPDCRPVSR